LYNVIPALDKDITYGDVTEADTVLYESYFKTNITIIIMVTSIMPIQKPYNIQQSNFDDDTTLIS